MDSDKDHNFIRIKENLVKNNIKLWLPPFYLGVNGEGKITGELKVLQAIIVCSRYSFVMS